MDIEKRERATCKSKTRFATRAGATKFLDYSRAGLRVYPCDYCNGYHVTSDIKRAAGEFKKRRTKE